METSVTAIQRKKYNFKSNSSSVTFQNNALYTKSAPVRFFRTDVSLRKYLEIEDLNQKFYFDSEVVKPFLLQNFMLVSALKRAYTQLTETLPGSIFILEVSSDFEVEDWKTLFINCINNLQDPNFEEKLQDFILEWMFNEDPELRKLITIKEIY